MLTAITKTGKELCLGYDFKKEALVVLRSKEEFFCPICGESVQLKLGDQRIFHFAHKRGGTCQEFYDHESYYHLEGKKQLYQWLTNQNIPAVLEYFDKEIQQRPDIMFEFNGQKYALEFQCSPIPEEIFTKRTRTYIENHYVPIWILASSQLNQQQRKDIVSLSNFHYLFLRSPLPGTYYIPSYCPEKQLFHFVESITPYSIKNAFNHQTFYKLESLDITNLLAPKTPKTVYLPNWKRERDKVILNMTRYPDQMRKKFLLEIYNKCLNPFLLPLEIGLPVPHSVLIQTPSVIWQTYIYLDVLANKTTNDVIFLHQIKNQFNMRIRRHEVTLRNLPQLGQINPLQAVLEYFQYLTKLGVLSKKGEDCFIIKEKIFIPHSNREKEENLLRFNQKHGLLFKIINEN